MMDEVSSNLTLEEAIKHCEKVAEENEKESKLWEGGVSKAFVQKYEKLRDCSFKYRQLAEWLRELKAYRESWEYLFATIFEIKSNAENEDVRNLANFLLKYMRIYEKEIREVKADDKGKSVSDGIENS